MNVRSGDAFVQTNRRGELVQVFRNRAADRNRIPTAHASVESVVIETTEWAKKAHSIGIKTTDQEFFHVVEAVNSSRYAAAAQIFAGVLVTDNISARPGRL